MIPQPLSQSSAPAPGAPPPSVQPAPGEQDPNAQGDPVQFDVHIESTSAELEDAIAVLKEAGLENIADVLQKALQGPPEDANAESTKSLTDEISAMGSSPHSGMN